jgi:phage terminase large subunit-like protein
LVTSVLQTIDAALPIRTVHARRSKQLRAEPIQALYEAHRVHHVGVFPELESEMTEWVPGMSKSPNRLDALIYGLTELAAGKKKATMRRWAMDETGEEPTPALRLVEPEMQNDPMMVPRRAG